MHFRPQSIVEPCERGRNQLSIGPGHADGLEIALAVCDDCGRFLHDLREFVHLARLFKCCSFFGKPNDVFDRLVNRSVTRFWASCELEKRVLLEYLPVLVAVVRELLHLLLGVSCSDLHRLSYLDANFWE